MLHTEEGAKARFERYQARFTGEKGVIEGIELANFNSYIWALREFQPLSIDLSPLTDNKNWFIINIEGDLTNETMSIDIMEV